MSNQINTTILFASIFILSVLLFLVIYPFDFKKEKFTSESKSESELELSKGPEIDKNSHYIMDGPDYEKFPLEKTKESNIIPSNYYLLDDGANGDFTVHRNLCSKSCCSEQWPTPFKQKYDPFVCNNKDKFVPSQITCNNSYQDSGCLCLSKKQADFLYNRGGNGREWF